MFSRSLLWSALLVLSFSHALHHTTVHAVPLQRRDSSNVVEAIRRATDRRSATTTRRGVDIPITRRAPRRGDALGHGKRAEDVTGSVGLGDHSDLLYTVPIEYENTGVTIAVNIDTGSSDHWVITDQCNTRQCQQSNSARLPSAGLQTTGASVFMAYGDSTTGTSASGPVAVETITIAGVTMANQTFAAINKTDNVAIQFGASGIFGMGFPSGSQIQQAVVNSQFGATPGRTDNFIKSIYTDGPLTTRIAMTGALDEDVFAISLQRNEVDIGGTGMLSIGKLPDGITDDMLTWVPVRLYSVADGGMPPPSFAPDEVYPFRWEIELDGVFLDGKQLPASKLSGTSPGKVSALIDTGNSLLRGPQDLVDTVLSSVSSSYASGGQAPVPCNVPHTLAYQIGGKMFPVDPRDFISPSSNGGAVTCLADNLVSTDAPAVGAQFSWSLGDPFFKSNLIAFRFGNNTHPSVDPPRVGLLSLVPADADAQLQKAVQDAANAGGTFESTLEAAPTQQAQDAPDVTVQPTTPGASPSSSATDAASRSSDGSGDKQPDVTGTKEVAAAATPSQEGAAVSLSGGVLRGRWAVLAVCVGLGLGLV